MAFSKTQFVYITGKFTWAKLKVPETAFSDKPKWTITVYPNEASLEIIRELQAEGMKNILKKDEDGYHIKFGRPTERRTKEGRAIGMDPPMVLNGQNLDKDGNPLPLGDVLVGNGSDGVIKLEVYEHRVPGSEKKAKAARLLSVRVDNLVPYTINKDFDTNQNRAIKGLDQQPEQLW